MMKEKLIELASKRGFNQEIVYDLFKDLKERIILFNFYFQALTEDITIPNDSKMLADDLAKIIKEDIGGPINDTLFEDYETFKRQTYRINHIIETINEHFKTEIPKIKVSREYYEKLKVARKTMSYVPLVDSYNNLYYSSLKLPSDKNEHYWEFYKNLFLLGADIAFIEGKIGYRAAFKSTWEISNTLKLYNAKGVLGNKGYGLLLSEIHWLIRAEIGKGWVDLKDALRRAELI
ncbi:hypothetical protein [Ferroglobus placidus]|uniref:hypothetical protein n=1 Tax=Ferroglobus placidus TaxID=54261 RepID=UPI0011D16204|nr:hypothetical protein [Ferroglobus placidus]